MSLKNKTELEPNVWTLEIAIEAADFRAEIQKVYQKQKKKINVPGFRRGKAPLAFVEKYYGKDMFHEDALQALYPGAIETAYEEGGIKAAVPPYDMDVKEIGDEGVLFTVNVAVKPAVELAAYKGLAVEKHEISVEETEVDAEIDRLRERNSRVITAEREAKEGDIAVIDFEGFLDGEAFEGGKGEQFELTLGSGQFIPGFEERVVGHSAGEDFAIDVTFPEEYSEPLAGKAAVFQVKLHELKVKELPELDDEFAKDLGEYDTVAELREGIRKDILGRKQDAEDHSLEHRVLEALAEQLSADIPEAIYKDRAEETEEHFGRRLSQQGLDIDTYLSYMGMDRALYEAQNREQAEEQLKIEFALEKVAELENLAPTDEEVEAEYARLAEQYSMEAEKLKTLISEDSVKADLNRAAATKLVVEHSVAKEPEAEAAESETPDAPAEEKKPAAKKPAAKKASAKKKAVGSDVPGAPEEPAAAAVESDAPTTPEEPATAEVDEAKPAAKKPAAKKPAAKKAPAKKPAAKKEAAGSDAPGAPDQAE